MSGRHRPTGLFSHRAVRTPLIVLSALSLIGLTTVALRAVNADADGCSSSGIRLTVAADPSIAPAINEIASRWTATHPSIGGDCIRVEVSAKPSYELANSLGTFAGGAVDVAAKPAPTPAEADLPVVWIPDSTYWLGRVRAVDRDAFEAVAPSVATSPIVLAMPEPAARDLAEKVGKGLDATALKTLIFGKAIKLGMVEPRRDTAGMVGAMMLSDAVVASPKDMPTLVKLYREGVAVAPGDTAGLWQAFAKGLTGAPVSEQAVLAFNATSPAAPVAAVQLAQVPTLDFPYAVLSRQPRPQAAAAALFQAALTGGVYRSVFAEKGLRAPDGSATAGFPTGHGVTTAVVHVLPLNDMSRVRSALTVWVAAKTPSRVIALADGTSSMARVTTGNGNTAVRIEVMRGAAEYGLNLFTDDSSVGLWAFAGPGHRELVPLAELGPPTAGGQRAKLKAAVNAATPQPTDVCPLYNSILAGYRALLSGYDESLSNTLVVFTDGGDNTGLQLRNVQKELEKLADITKPIRVVLLGIGPDVRMNELEEIAKTTGGVAFQVSDPTQIRGIFLTALLA